MESRVLDVGQEQAPALQPRLGSETQARTAPKQTPRLRLVSLDAFRGFVILGMLLVNNVALDTATPPQLTHAQWNQGLHFADLVFPWFLLIVGVAIPYSLASQKAKGVPSWRIASRVLWRAVLLVLLGLLVDSSIAKKPVLGLGVLQLIGLAYLVGAALYWLPPKARLPVAALLLFSHWAALRLLIVPGMEPGVLAENANLVQHLNDLYLRPLHLNGIISVIPTAALVLIGTAVGDLLRREQTSPARRLEYLATAGVGLAAAGWLWSLDIHFSKAVWTASYIVYTAGLGCIVLASLYLVADVLGWRRLVYPLVVPGTNAIFAYVAPILAKVYILQSWALPSAGSASLPLQQAYLNALIRDAGRVAGGWLYTVTYILFWWLVLAWMHHRKILLRV